jgi:two-component system, chemotaxis family, protein-glutamate methylesterase/glutaminase
MATSARLEAMERTPIRVLVVDDSIVARAVLRRIVETDAGYRVTGSVPDAGAALTFLASERVDVVLLDVEMPGQNGIAALPAIVAAARGAPVMIVSTLCAAGAEASLNALAMGAADTLVKPGAGVLAGTFAEQLIERIDRLTRERGTSAAGGNPVSSAPPGRAPPRLIAIGASTGGIHALGRMLREFDRSCTAPIVITQHLPGSFMPYFAAQLAQSTGRPCHVAGDRMRLRENEVYVAPGDAHLTCIAMTEGAAIRLDRSPVPSGCLPSADPMFQTAGAVFGTGALGIVLSGMGRDGAQGARGLVEAGGSLIAQDRQSSVVWGMPGAVVDAGLAEAVLPPEAIGRLVRQRCAGAR